MGVGDVSKRILLGRKLRSTQLGETLLPKRVALPVFASDALSSVAYAPDEVFIKLSVAGVAGFAWSWKIAIAVSIVMLTVVASYRQNVHAYPSGGQHDEDLVRGVGHRRQCVAGEHRESHPLREKGLSELGAAQLAAEQDAFRDVANSHDRQG